MKDSRINTNKLKISKFVYIIVFFLFIVFCVSLTYRCLVDYKATDKLTISEFIQNRNIYEDVIMPERGSIYDANGNVLARDVSSYTIIAYLSTSRGEKDGIPRYVKDKEMTAKQLSEYIDTEYERILELLNRDAYQVEFGPGGKNLSQLEMEKIKDLNLPGIDFIKSTKRYYPNGDFASYLLGYTVNKEQDNGNTYMVGELGIEGYYNNSLTGKSGYIRYEKDGRGNIIANSNEYRREATDGNDVYLTIDSSIQLFIENELKKSQEESKAQWTVMGVIDAKTGAILGYSSTPSFDPNIRNLKNYMDPLISYAYEPGSTMKTFSYMCAIDSGKYNGSDTFMSGSKTYVSALDENDTVTIKDWNNGLGWGRISYDYGYAMSSNIGVANLLENVITKDELKTCYTKYGFGKKTDISLNGELSGNIDFTYDIEAATAGYGQGIMVTPIQMLQALTIVSNNGTMLKPYIVSKVVDSTGKTVLKNEKEEIGIVA
ncbi:MAG: penicillin-binding protein 2, partial [Bacilli bacterium]|nr:penicillin-binding protein 2 [Bacilli bacterium]